MLFAQTSARQNAAPDALTTRGDHSVQATAHTDSRSKRLAPKRVFPCIDVAAQELPASERSIESTRKRGNEACCQPQPTSVLCTACANKSRPLSRPFLEPASRRRRRNSAYGLDRLPRRPLVFRRAHPPLLPRHERARVQDKVLRDRDLLHQGLLHNPARARNPLSHLRLRVLRARGALPPASTRARHGDQPQRVIARHGRPERGAVARVPARGVRGRLCARECVARHRRASRGRQVRGDRGAGGERRERIRRGDAVVREDGHQARVAEQRVQARRRRAGGWCWWSWGGGWRAQLRRLHVTALHDRRRHGGGARREDRARGAGAEGRGDCARCCCAHKGGHGRQHPDRQPRRRRPG